MKKLVIVFTSLILLAFPSFSFAGDSDMSELPASIALAPSTSSEDLQLRQLSSSLAASSSVMNVDDIYKLLNDLCYYNTLTGQYELSTRDRDVYNSLRTYDSYNGDGITVADILYRSLLGSRWDTGTGQISVLEAMKTMWSTNHADQLAQMLKQQNIINSLSTLDSDLRSDLGKILLAVNNFISANHSDLQGLRDDFNKISFVRYPESNILNSVTVNGNAVSLPSSVNSTISYNLNTPLISSSDGNIVKYILPFRYTSYVIDSKPSISFRISYNGNTYPVYPTYYQYYLQGGLIFIYTYNNIAWGEGNLIININPHGSVYIANEPCYSYVLTADSQDYYTVYNSLLTNHIDSDLHYQNSQLDKFVELYASDDLIAAKRAQQSTEDAAISGFTGSGDASASVNDITGAKDVSKALKSGLDAGVSSGNSLAIFDSSKSFWGWFSNDCASYFQPIEVPALVHKAKLKSKSLSNPDKLQTFDGSSVYDSYNDEYYQLLDELELNND